MKARLNKKFFTDKESLFLEEGELKVFLYHYENGVCAAKLVNSKGYITILPFNGQMVWDAVMEGRSLKMETSFDTPRICKDFKDTYGCYIMHCGALGMGCPSVKDSHAHHGELPYAEYHTAYCISGSDEKGRYIGITGEYEYNQAFGKHYIARPVAKLYENSTLMTVGINIKNLNRCPMEYMYMCHVNNKIEPGAEVYQTLPWTNENMVVRTSIPQYNEPDPAFMDLLSRVQGDVNVTKIVNEKDLYDPEIVLFLRGVRGDAEGKAHFLYRHLDGSADYTMYDADVLNKSVRWMVFHKDWNSMGMVLPATAEPEGYTAEKEKGNVRVLGSGDTFETELAVGYLNAKQAEKVKEKIEKIMG